MTNYSNVREMLIAHPELPVQFLADIDRLSKEDEPVGMGGWVFSDYATAEYGEFTYYNDILYLGRDIFDGDPDNANEGITSNDVVWNPCIIVRVFNSEW